MAYLLILLLGYLAGSIPSAIWVGKIFFKKDVRDFGSGNAGATNVYRVLGWKPALFVVVFDIAKGALPTWYALQLVPPGYEADPVTLQMLAGFAAVLGHCFTCFARFRGGKGIATAAGMMLILFPVALPVCLLVFALVVWRTRYVSLASILASLMLVVVHGILVATNQVPWSPALIGLLGVLFVFVLFTHRANIGRLLKGEENKIY